MDMDIKDMFITPKNTYSYNLYKELKDKYGKEAIFDIKDEFNGIPAETVYHNGDWIINISLEFECHKDIDRIISHELLHVLLRYRHNLPYIIKNSTPIQVEIFHAIDHKIINSELDKIFGVCEDVVLSGNAEVLDKINPYLKNLQNNNINRERYIDIYKKCTDIFGESMPQFVL